MDFINAQKYRRILASSLCLFILMGCLRHLFVLSPFTYSFEIFSSKYHPNTFSNKVVGIDEDRFPADAHGAVYYQGVPWRTEIGRWLSSCDSISEEVDIVESIHEKGCQKDCSDQGVCNKELGQCRCFHGFDGEDCSIKLQLNCNLLSTPDQPYGPWIVSMCSASCDTTRAMCFCGEGTSYPNRPVAEACGFATIFPSKLGDPVLTNFSVADRDIFTTNTSKLGWCNVDPKEAYASRVKYREGCNCNYDGQTGLFCETPTTSSCINQCSLRGYCRGGACQCNSGWYGTDCSIPSVSVPLREWPNWLQPSSHQFTSGNKISAVVKNKRPLIYVYDLPSEFTNNLLEGRHNKFQCVNRVYNERNRTTWIHTFYGAQIALYETILASAHRTLNAEEADYFYVPSFDSCVIVRADHSPHFREKDHVYVRSFHVLDIYKKVYDHIVKEYPFWNRTAGKDHIWFFSWDEGACCAPKEMSNSIMVVHSGNTNSEHNHSTTAYWGDNWDPLPLDRRGDHKCFYPSKDIIIPSWKTPDPGDLPSKLLYKDQKERKTFFYFNGNLGPAYTGGRPEDKYSLGIRQRIGEEFGSVPNKQGKLGRQHEEGIIVTPIRSSDYNGELGSSIFCGVFPGDGWSSRMEDSVLHGCIPVIIQDGIFLPYENVLNFESFAIRIREDEIPNMIKILRKINDTEIDFMLANVRSIRQRFIYRDAVILEADRQKRLFGEPIADWAVEFSKLEEDDVFSTFIQVLNFKLHNDPWRRNHVDRRKKFGLPKACFDRNS